MATHERPGRLPGRQTEVANAGEEFDARGDLDRQKHLPESARARIRVTNTPQQHAQVTDPNDRSGPRGENQQSRRRGSQQS